jgi:uncharacterized protein YidB (DUF937 family)
VDIEKFSVLLDDPEVRVIVYGLAHAYPAPPKGPGVEGLRAALLRLMETADPAQVESWLSDQAVSRAITVEQIRAAFGDEVISDLASFAGSGPDAVTWQLSTVLPDLVDASTPGGVIADADEIGWAFLGASYAGDRSAGAFGPHVD